MHFYRKGIAKSVIIAALAAIVIVVIPFGHLVRGTDNGTGNTTNTFLMTRPALAATSSSTTFPDPDAGMSAYAKIDPSLMDFDKILTLFTTADSLITAGSNYVIGSMPVDHGLYSGSQRFGTGISETVRLYADRDGYLIAYVTKDQLASSIFSIIPSNAPNVDTVLNEALYRAKGALGVSSVGAISWYDWSHPSASHLALATKYVYALNSSSTMILATMPTTLVVPASYYFASFITSCSYAGSLERDGLVIQEQGSTTTAPLVGSVALSRCARSEKLDSLNLQAGLGYTFKTTHAAGTTMVSFLGIAAVY